MTFRIDLQKRNDELRRKIETMRSVLVGIDKKISDAIADEVARGHEANIAWLSDQRAAVWNDIKAAKDALAEVDAEKKRIITDAGFDWRKLPINIDSMPCTFQDMSAWLHGTKQPQRDEILSKLIEAGMVDRHPGQKGVEHVAAA